MDKIQLTINVSREYIQQASLDGLTHDDFTEKLLNDYLEARKNYQLAEKFATGIVEELAVLSEKLRDIESRREGLSNGE